MNEKTAPTLTAHKNLAAAKLAFQGDIKSLEKNATVSFGNTGYDYIDLAGILDYVLPILTKHGILLEQYNVERDVNNTRKTADGTIEEHYARTLVGIRTIVTHVESGESMSNTLCDPSEVKDIKGRGALITYLRRYSILTVLGLSAEDDDAGSGGKKKQPLGTGDPEQRKQQPPPKTDDKKPAGQPPKSALPAANEPLKKTDEEIQAEFKELGLDSKEAKEALTSVNIGTMQGAIAFRKKFGTTQEMIEGIMGAQSGQ